MTSAEHAATAIRAVLEQVTAFEVGDPRRFNEAAAAIGYLDELAALAERATELERANSEGRAEEAELRAEYLAIKERATELERERDDLRWQMRRERDEIEQRYVRAENKAIRDAKARAERAETALRQIRDEQVAVRTHTGVTHTSKHGYAAQDIARDALGETAPTYDRERHAWVGQCPHGDMCSRCDAIGYCEREEAALGETAT